MRVCTLSHFGHVQLFVTLWTVACQVPVFIHFPGKNTGWVAVPSSRGSSQPRDQTCVSYIFCIGRQLVFFFFFFFTTGTTWEVLFIVAINQYKCLPADDWINRKWYIHKIEYKLALKSLKVFLISEKNRWQPWNYVILCIFSVQRKLI